MVTVSFAPGAKIPVLCKAGRVRGLVFQERPVELLRIPEQLLYRPFFLYLYGCRYGYLIDVFLFRLCGYCKGCVGKTKSERI